MCKMIEMNTIHSFIPHPVLPDSYLLSLLIHIMFVDTISHIVVHTVVTISVYLSAQKARGVRNIIDQCKDFMVSQPCLS